MVPTERIQSPPPNGVLVHNMPLNFNVPALDFLLGQCGQITHRCVITADDRRRTTGFVAFLHPHCAQVAVVVFDGSWISTNVSRINDMERFRVWHQIEVTLAEEGPLNIPGNVSRAPYSVFPTPPKFVLPPLQSGAPPFLIWPPPPLLVPYMPTLHQMLVLLTLLYLGL